MVLDTETIRKINEFVYARPRTIQEIAQLIKRDWKTADRYVEKISLEHGTISTATFRGGTRGALKIAYWNNIEKIHSTQVQERVYNNIINAKKKQDFSPLDIYQYADEKKREAFQEDSDTGEISSKQDLASLLRGTEKQLMIFSGNVSWINQKQGKLPIAKVIEELVKNNISIKVLTRVDIASLENLKKLKEIDHKLGKNMIEVRHCEQPLRGFVIDSKVIRVREEKSPEQYKKGELKEPLAIYYTIYDEAWVEWIQKLFWNLFRTSVDMEKRLKDIKTIK